MTLWRDGVRVTETVAPATFVVAAADSYYRHRRHADFVCHAADSLKFINDVVVPYIPAAGGKVLFLDGTYSMDTNNGIALGSSTNITFSGMGPNTNFKVAAGFPSGPDGMITVDGTGGKCTFENLCFTTNGTGCTGYPLNLAGSAGENNVRNNKFVTLANDGVVCAQIQGGNNNIFSGNTHIGGGVGDLCNMVIITGGYGHVINGNSAYNAQSAESIVVDGTYNTVISNNAIRYANYGISDQVASETLITGNSIFNSVDYGIALNASTGAHVSENEIYYSTKDGIYAWNLSFSKITGNTVAYSDAGNTNTYSAINLGDTAMTPVGNTFNDVSNNTIIGTSVTYQKYGINLGIVGNDNAVAGIYDNSYTTVKGNVFTGDEAGAARVAEIYYVYPASAPLDLFADTINYFRSETDDFTSVKEADTDYVVDAENISSGGPAAATIAHQPDVPRNVTIAITQVGGTITSSQVEIQGYDAKGRYCNESLQSPAGGSWTQTGNIAFAKIVYVYWEAVGAGAGDTLDVGIGTKLGLSGALLNTGDVTYIEQSGAMIANPAAITDATYDTVAPTIVEPDDIVVYYRNCLNSITKKYTDTI